ncbi:hypothetical protein EV361DRAFT_955228 [Lentinula raphanica]|nr:hypothetical protein EV361DRAFT_955228 [Lentinula raphanica]
MKHRVASSKCGSTKHPKESQAIDGSDEQINRNNEKQGEAGTWLSITSDLDENVDGNADPNTQEEIIRLFVAGRSGYVLSPLMTYGTSKSEISSTLLSIRNSRIRFVCQKHENEAEDYLKPELGIRDSFFAQPFPSALSTVASSRAPSATISLPTGTGSTAGCFAPGTGSADDHTQSVATIGNWHANSFGELDADEEIELDLSATYILDFDTMISD